MATLSSPGIGSGLDVNGIVAKLLALESAPLQKLQTGASTLQTRLSAIGQLQSLVSSLRDALAPLAKPSTFTQMQGSSSDPSAVAVTATTSSAAAGRYSVSVSTLASGQTLVSPAGQYSAATDPVGTGTLTIRLGRWSGDPPSAFTPKSGSSDVTVPIGADQNTLAGVRDAINAANAGVLASIVTDANGARLSLRSAETGLDNGFRITVSDDDGTHTNDAGLSRLAYDPAGGAAQMSRVEAAANTAATVNGIAVSTATDTLADAIEGVTLKLTKTTAAPVTVTVAANVDAVKASVGKFVSAYNALNKFLSDATRYDAEKKQAALFQGDASIVGLQNQLRQLVAQAGLASGVFQTLSSMGVQMQKDGSLSVNGARLDEALKQLPEVAKAFSNAVEAQPALDGVARRLQRWTDQLLEATGTLPSRANSLQDQLRGNQREQERLTTRLLQTEKRLRAQYGALDTLAAKYSALNNFVSQFATNLQNSNRRS